VLYVQQPCSDHSINLSLKSMGDSDPEHAPDSGDTAGDFSGESTVSPEQCDCDPAREVRFAFGPNGNYFISTSDSERWWYRSYAKSAL
jgi:hypothetical protein